MRNHKKSTTDVLTDLAAVCRLVKRGGIVKDRELLRRVYKRSAAGREAMRKKFGTQDIGADIIRKLRNKK